MKNQESNQIELVNYPGYYACADGEIYDSNGNKLKKERVQRKNYVHIDGDMLPVDALIYSTFNGEVPKTHIIMHERMYVDTPETLTLKDKKEYQKECRDKDRINAVQDILRSIKDEREKCKGIYLSLQLAVRNYEKALQSLYKFEQEEGAEFMQLVKEILLKTNSAK